MSLAWLHPQPEPALGSLLSDQKGHDQKHLKLVTQLQVFQDVFISRAKRPAESNTRNLSPYGKLERLKLLKIVEMENPRPGASTCNSSTSRRRSLFRRVAA